MENNDVKKSNKGLIVLIVMLILIVLGLSGYIVYDKFMTKQEVKDNETIKTNQENNDELKEEKKVLKKDESKELVYTLYESKSSHNLDTKIPKVNIDSIYADKVNNEILALMYENYETIDGFKCKDYCSQIIYNSYLNDNVLSLIIKDDSAESPNAHKYFTYNIDIYTGEEITNKELIKIKGIQEDEFPTKLSNIFKEAYPFDKYYDGNNNYGGEKEFATQTYDETVSLRNCSVDNPMFLNENGELNVVIGVYYYAGGEGATYSLVNMDTKQYIYYENYKM